MKSGFYLSDVAHNTMRREAAQRGWTLGRYINESWPEWVTRKVVIRDSGLIELIENRKENIMGMNVVERGDRIPPKFKSRPEHDGVVWLAMFGAWQRRRRVYDIDEDGVEALAGWVVNQEVVRRRASSATTLASQALELIGRGWTEKVAVGENSHRVA